MCYAIIKIDYRSSTEQSQTVEVEKAEDLSVKIEEIKGRPEVRKVTWFLRYMSTELVSAWKETSYEKGNKGYDSTMFEQVAKIIPRS